MPFTGLVLQPYEVETVQGVFKTVTTLPWFDRTPANERDFAAFVLRSYRDGIADPDRLTNFCIDTALVRFCRRA